MSDEQTGGIAMCPAVRPMTIAQHIQICISSIVAKILGGKDWEVTEHKESGWRVTWPERASYVEVTIEDGEIHKLVLFLNRDHRITNTTGVELPQEQDSTFRIYPTSPVL